MASRGNTTVNGSPPSSDGNSSGKTAATADHLAGKFDFIEALRLLSIDVGLAELHERQEPGVAQHGDQQVFLNSNVYRLIIGNMPIYQYHLELEKEYLVGGVMQRSSLFPTKKDDPATLIKFPDFSTVDNRQRNRCLVDALIARNPEVFGDNPDLFLYDFASTLYSLIELKPSEKKLVLDAEAVQQLLHRNFVLYCEVKPPAEPGPSFNSRDFESKFCPNLEDHKDDVIRFLELATSRHASLHPEEHVMYESKKTYFMDPEKYGMVSLNLGGGKYLAPGAAKTVQVVQGPQANGVAVVAIDSKKTPFYRPMNLLDMIRAGVGPIDPFNGFRDNQYSAAEKYVKNLEVFPTYGQRQGTPITLKGFSTGNAENNYANDNGESVKDYFDSRYGITLGFLKLPLAVGARKVNGKYPLYPLELLNVADNQRVRNSNITASDISAVVKSCAVVPIMKSNEIAGCHTSFAFPQDRFLAAATIEVMNQPMQVQGRILKHPTIHYANDEHGVAPGSNGKWRIARDAKFLRATRVPKWSAVLLQFKGDRLSLDEFKKFVRMYEKEMQNRGIGFQPLADFDIIKIDANESSIVKLMNDSRTGAYKFLLFAHPDIPAINQLHAYIKGMERKFEIITQCIKTKTIFNVLQNKMLSLENIVAKTNVKLGGINYNCVLRNSAIDKTILFIGLGLNHPGGGVGAASNIPNLPGSDGKEGSFSVLGFAANDGNFPNEFVGNFFFQPVNLDEKVTVLDSLIHEVLDRFKKNRGFPPTRVIVYRNGCSENAFIKVLRYEVPIIRAMVRDMAPKAKVSFIIPSKMHSVRLFHNEINEGDRAVDQNIRPGTVVDTTIVSMAFSEFYLNSHLAIQGTAKPVKYTVLYTDEETTSLDQIQRWTNALAYDFQIVSSPTSLPAPVYIANRYAERGRQILNTFQSSGQIMRAEELELGNAKKNGNGDGESPTSGGTGSPTSGGTGSPTNGGKIVMGKSPGKLSGYYQKSLNYNYTKRPELRTKRVNA